MRRAARWLWDHKRLVVGTTAVAAGAYAGYVVWQKKRELEALCEELLSLQGTQARSEESAAKEHFDKSQPQVNSLLSIEMPKVAAQLKRLLDTKALMQKLKPVSYTHLTLPTILLV